MCVYKALDSLHIAKSIALNGVELAAVEDAELGQQWAHWPTAKLMEQPHGGMHIHMALRAVANCEGLSWSNQACHELFKTDLKSCLFHMKEIHVTATACVERWSCSCDMSQIALEGKSNVLLSRILSKW